MRSGGSCETQKESRDMKRMLEDYITLLYPDVQAEKQPQIEPTAVDDQRYPVDDVTMPTPCELHVRASCASKKYIHSCCIRVSPAVDAP